MDFYFESITIGSMRVKIKKENEKFEFDQVKIIYFSKKYTKFPSNGTI